MTQSSNPTTSIEMDVDYRINPLSLTIERDRFNKPVILGELLGGDRFSMCLNADNKPEYIEGFGDTVFEHERSPSYEENADRVYTNAALHDVNEWLSTQDVPDFTGMPLELSEFLYLNDHPIGMSAKDVVLQFTINGWDSDVLLLTADHLDIRGEDEANMLVFIDHLPGDVQAAHKAVFHEMADICRDYIKRNPYHRADSLLSHFMRYGTKYAYGDHSELIRYDIPVKTYKSAPQTTAERIANAIPARLVVNRKDTYWEAILYASEDLSSRMSQSITALNGGFGSEYSHEDFLLRVQTVYSFTGGIEFDFVSENFDPIKLAS